MKERQKKKMSLRNKVLTAFCIYICMAVIYYLIAYPQLQYDIVSMETDPPEAETRMDFSEYAEPVVVEQDFTLPPKAASLKGFSIYFGSLGIDKKGEIEFTLLDDDEIIFQKSVSESEITESKDKREDFRIPLAIRTDTLTLRVKANTGAGISYYDEGVEGVKELRLNGVPIEGMLCFGVQYGQRTPFLRNYLLFTGVLGFLIFGYAIHMLYCEKKGKLNMGLGALYAFEKYSFLLSQLVSKDFKTKYRRSILGVIWSVLNPLMMMLVLSAIFEFVFRHNIDNFPVYLILGQTLFALFSDATNNAMMSIMASSGLIKKVYIPKYIFPMEKVLFAFVNFCVSLIAVSIVLFVSGVQLHLTILFLPLLLVYFLLFTSGVAVFMSCIAVFFRDMLHLYGVLLTVWMYATPIIYPIETLGAKMQFLLQLNPLTHYVVYFRNIVMLGIVPSLRENIICLVVGVFSMLIGFWVFKRQQDKFILHI